MKSSTYESIRFDRFVFGSKCIPINYFNKFFDITALMIGVERVVTLNHLCCAKRNQSSVTAVESVLEKLAGTF